MFLLSQIHTQDLQDHPFMLHLLTWILPSLPSVFSPWESSCIISWVNCIFLGWIRHISLEGERDVMWTSSCLLHATEKKSLISTVYILYNCSLTFPLCLLIKVKENRGEMFQRVFLGQEKLHPSFVYKYRVFQGPRESVVFTGRLLKFITIFPLEPDTEHVCSWGSALQWCEWPQLGGGHPATLRWQPCDRWCCVSAGKTWKGLSPPALHQGLRST